MTIEQANQLIFPVCQAAEAEGDALFWCYFSRKDDDYAAFAHNFTPNMDAGDALIIVGQLIKDFKLSPQAISAMDKS